MSQEDDLKSTEDNGSEPVQKTSGWVFLTLAVIVALGFAVWSSIEIFERWTGSPYLAFLLVAKIGTSSGFWGCIFGTAAGFFEKNPLGYLSLFIFIPLLIVGILLRGLFVMMGLLWF